MTDFVTEIYTALQGKDEKGLINIIVNKSNEQLQEIKQAYQTTYSEDIIKVLEDKLSGNFQKVVVGLFQLPAVYDSQQLYQAMKGWGTDEKSLIEILTSRTPIQIEEIKKEFIKIDGKSLEDWLKGEISGDFLQLILALLKSERNDNEKEDVKKCRELGQRLAELDKLKWEDNEASDFYNFLIKCSPSEVGLTSRYFHKFKGKTIIEAIDKDFSSDLKKALKSLIFAVMCPEEFCATHIYEAMKGAGTDDKVLIRMMVTRKEDLPLIKRYYQKKYNQDMIEDIIGDTSGSYKDILVAMANL